MIGSTLMATAPAGIPSVLLSASAIAAVVGGCVTFLLTRSITLSRVRAEREVAAQDALREAVLPLYLSARLYQRGFAHDLKRQGSRPISDMRIAVDVLAAARDLRPLRRVRVRRICKILFGSDIVSFARAMPGTAQDSDLVAVVFEKYLIAESRWRWRGDDIFGVWREHLLHEAMSSDPKSRAVRQLIRRLAWLARP